MEFEENEISEKEIKELAEMLKLTFEIDEICNENQDMKMEE